MEILTAGIAGALGAAFRYAFYLLFEYGGVIGSFPLSTFTVNVTGSFLLSFSLGLSTLYLKKIDRKIKQAAISGFVGSFTTFSGIMLELFRLQEGGKTGILLLYLVSSILVGIVFLRLGILCAQKLSKRHGEEVKQ